MPAYLFLFLYLLHGQPVLEQKLFTDQDVCISFGEARIADVARDPRVESVICGVCATVETQQATVK